MLNLFNLAAKISLDDKDYNSKMKKASDSGDKLGKSGESTGKKLLSMGNIIKGVAVGAVGVFIKSTVEAAAALEQTNKKTDVIFGNMSQQAKDWALENERTFGAGAGTIQGYLNNISDLTQGMGLAKDASFDMAKGATELGVQLANWNGIDSGQAIDDLTRALSGSHEVVAKYGIKLNEASLNQTAMNMGLGDSFNQLDEATKAQVRYQAMLDASGNAIQYWDEGNRSMTFHLNEAKEQFGNIKEVIGGAFLPVAKKGAELFADFVTEIATFVGKIPVLVEEFKIGLDATGSVAEGLAYAIEEVFGIKIPDTVYNMMESVINFFGELWTILQEVWSTVGVPLFDIITETWNTLSGSADVLFDLISVAFDVMTEAIKIIWETILKPVFDFIMDVVGQLADVFNENFGMIEGIFKDCIDFIKQIWEGILKPVLSAISDYVQNVLLPIWKGVFEEGILPAVKNVFKMIGDLWDNSLKPIFQGIIDFVSGVFSGDWSRAWDGVVSIFGGIMNGLGTVIKAPLNAVIGLINAAIGGLNSISVSIPDWVPFVGGNTFGVNIPTISYLEEGGILTEPTMLNENVMAGEKNKGRQSQAEVVIPLDKLEKWIMELASRPVNVEIDGRETMRALAGYKEELDDYDTRYSFA